MKIKVIIALVALAINGTQLWHKKKSNRQLAVASLKSSLPSSRN